MGTLQCALVSAQAPWQFPSVAAWALCNVGAFGPWYIIITFPFRSHPPTLFLFLKIEKVEPRQALGCVVKGHMMLAALYHQSYVNVNVNVRVFSAGAPL